MNSQFYLFCLYQGIPVTRILAHLSVSTKSTFQEICRRIKVVWLCSWFPEIFPKNCHHKIQSIFRNTDPKCSNEKFARAPISISASFQ